MIRAILAKELREYATGSKFLWIFAVCSIVILLGFWSGARHYQVAQRQYEAARQANFRQQQGLTDWGQVQQNITMPPNVLAALVSGISNDVGRNVSIRGMNEVVPQDSRFNEDPVFAVFRFLDLEFLFQVILALFAILLAYNSVCGEKEQGTLRLIFSNGVGKDQYLVAKWLGAILGLAVPLSIPLALGCLLLVVMEIPLTADEWWRLVAILATGLLYFSLFLTLSVFVSSRTQRSTTSFLLLLIVWIGSVFVWPRMSVLIAGRLVDVPSVDEVAAEKSAFQYQVWSEHLQKIGAYRSAPSDDPDKVFQEFQKFMSQMAEERDRKINAFADRVNENRRNRQKAQESVTLNLARLSPASALSLAMTALAGTSLDLHNRFVQSATDYRNVFESFVRTKTGNAAHRGMRMVIADGREKPKPIDPSEIPGFHFDASSGPVESVIVDAGLLLFGNLLFFGLALASFIRYDVR
jgi:ABC-type transport system involved in multi-copper enzyme maturation permease subunit